MKKNNKLILTFLLANLFTFSVIPFNLSNTILIATAQDQYITVQGMTSSEGITKDLAQKKALADAFKNAVEKGIGVWVKSQSEVSNFELKKDEILTRSEGYVLDHEILKESEEKGLYTVTIKAKVAVEKIGADLKQLVGRVKTQMGNPSVAFVLTTWENRGIKVSLDYTQNNNTSMDTKASDGVKSITNYNNNNSSYIETKSTDPNTSVEANMNSNKKLSIQQIDETVWKKYPDMTILDSFKQEFLEKGFDLKASDNAINIAVSESLAKTGVNVTDRSVVRSEAEKEGANFVARGEVQVIDMKYNKNTASYVSTSKLGVEIIDVNSGDVVASYSNTANASSSSEQNAKAQSIKKIAILASKVLASQTIDKWQERANNGMKFVVELRNMTSIRGQKLPFLKAVKSLAEVNSQTSPTSNTFLLNLTYKGKKDELGEKILEKLASEKGFSETEFDGPIDEAGKIVFTFKK